MIVYLLEMLNLFYSSPLYQRSIISEIIVIGRNQNNPKSPED